MANIHKHTIPANLEPEEDDQEYQTLKSMEDDDMDMNNHFESDLYE